MNGDIHIALYAGNSNNYGGLAASRTLCKANGITTKTVLMTPSIHVLRPTRPHSMSPKNRTITVPCKHACWNAGRNKSTDIRFQGPTMHLLAKRHG